jgi:hypothetical protein
MQILVTRHWRRLPGSPPDRRKKTLEHPKFDAAKPLTKSRRADRVLAFDQHVCAAWLFIKTANETHPPPILLQPRHGACGRLGLPRHLLPMLGR